jgi:hypothetical protein
MRKTLGILLGPLVAGFNILSSVFMMFLSPVLAHVLNAVILFTICGAAFYFLTPMIWSSVASLPTMFFKAGWSLFRIREFPISLEGWSTGTSMVCTVVPFLCTKQADGKFVFGHTKEQLDVAHVAHALSEEGEVVFFPPGDVQSRFEGWD